MTETLQGKHAVITGGGSGIGAAIATRLADAGARTTLMGRRQKPLEQTAETLAEAQAITCDVTSYPQVVTAFQQATENYGPVDILVNNAGVAPTSAFRKLSPEEWHAIIGLNLDGVFYCTRQVLDQMLAQGWGRIINIASTAALKGYAYVSAYCAAKHGVLGLTRALALETAESGITVNAVCPGFTDTDMIRNAVNLITEKTGRSEAEILKEFIDANPQKRLIKPEEVANTVLWLSDPASSAVTGQAISVSGGEVM